MRGAVGEKNRWKKADPMRYGPLISHHFYGSTPRRRRRAAVSAGSLPHFTFDFFLFCLTHAAISDNRHGLLKKFDSARAASTLSAA